MKQAAVADWHDAVRPDRLEEPTEKLPDLKVRRAEAGTAHFTVGKSDRAVREADETLIGDGDLEDSGGKGGEGGVAVVRCLTRDMPGDGPDLGVAILQQSGLAHIVLEDGSGDGGEGLHGDKAGGSGGSPRCAVRCAASARHNGVEVRMVLELSAPGVQDAGAPREGSPDTAFVGGQPLAGRCRRVQQGLGREALMRADAGSERCRDRAGEEAGWPGQRGVEVVLEPLLGCMRLTWRAVAMATGMGDAVGSPTGVARIPAGAVRAAWAVLDGTDDLAVRGGESGRALQGLGRPGGADSPEGGHGRSPCMRALRRS